MTKEKNVTETVSFCENIIFISGFLNCYTFVYHGGAFATMQTGNLIQGMYHLSQGHFVEAFSFFALNLIFLITTFATKYALDFWCKENELLWKRNVLVYGMVLLMIVGSIYPFVPDVVVNALIGSFAAAQYCAFRTFGDDKPYATIFCTGNMRSLVENIYNVVVKKDAECKENAKGYARILAAFAFGVLLCNVFLNMIGGFAIWFAVVILIGSVVRINRELKVMY